MIVTEQEALTKRCQESFGLGVDTWETTPANRRCIGSACMAWRWQRTEDGLPATDEFLGYCGKAGLP